MCKSLDYATELFNITDTIKAEWRELHNRLSIADKKRMDVEHYIEISNDLNASQGYKAYKLLKEVLEERRDVKNKIAELRPLNEAISSIRPLTQLTNRNKLINKIEATHNKNINSDEVKIYNVRVLKEIFGDTIKAQ